MTTVSADPRLSADLDRLADELRRLRVAAGCTQEELAGRAGLSDRTVRDMERGHRRPRPSTLRLLARALGLTEAQCAELESMSHRAYWADRGPDAPAAEPVGQLPPDIVEFVGRERELAPPTCSPTTSGRRRSAGSARWPRPSRPAIPATPGSRSAASAPCTPATVRTTRPSRSTGRPSPSPCAETTGTRSGSG